MSLSYDTALKLKEAGFPQKEWGDPNYLGEILMEGEDTTYSPTLSELIEAIDVFDALYNTNREPHWTASDGNGHVGQGSTPEEAVAALYLALKSAEPSS